MRRAAGRMTRVLVASALILSAALGARATFGLFLLPLADASIMSVSLLALALAVQNLMWGIAQPLAGGLADRYGSGAIVAAGALVYAAGLALVGWKPNALTIMLGLGVLAGVGQSAMTFAVVIAAVSRSASAAFRTSAVALAAAGGSLGQVALIPLVQSTIAHAGFRWTFLILAAIVLGTAPLGYWLRDRANSVLPTAAAASGSQTTWVAILSALRDPNYLLLTAGFFACGFQLAFLSNHLPAYLALCHAPAGLGAASLATIGFFNIIGTYGFGRLMQRFAPQYLLVVLYTVRATAAFVFAAVAPLALTSLTFAVIMGLTWLATVPLTNGVITNLFGLKNLGALFGCCFLSHQLGSFLGTFLGGVAVQWSGSYATAWTATIVIGYLAALVNVPIRTRAVASA